MRIGPWILLMGAVGCGGSDAADVGTGDTGDTGPVVNIITPAERPGHILGLIATADVALGKTKYEGLPGCAECHQVDGSGTVDFPPLTERLPLIENPRVVAVMLDGIPGPSGKSMPPYAADWSDPEIAAVIAYIRSEFDPAR